MVGLDTFAETTVSLLEDIKARAARSKKAMKDAEAREAQIKAGASAVKEGMKVTAGFMDMEPTPGSPGVSMFSRKNSHPSDGKKVPIKK